MLAESTDSLRAIFKNAPIDEGTASEIQRRPKTKRTVSEYLAAAEIVLRRHQRPMKVRELLDLALEARLLSDKTAALTPHRTFHARLAEDILRNGDQSAFVRTAPGVFFLRALLGRNLRPKPVPDGLPGEQQRGPIDATRTYAARRRLPPRSQESVLVLPQAYVRRKVGFQGFLPISERGLVRLLNESGAKHVPRMQAEASEAFKQVVTYVIARRGSRVLCFERGVFNRVAEFLRGATCLGFGGHVTDDDYSLFSRADFGLKANALRELHEEIGLSSRSVEAKELKVRGIINDDSSDAGRRHIAIVYEMELPKTYRLTKGEASINNLRWVSLTDGQIDINRFEYWSQLCWRALFPNLARTQANFRIVRAARFQRAHTIVILGSIGSGKSVAANTLRRRFGYRLVNSGQVLARILDVPPVPITSRAVFQQLANEFIRSNNGPKRLAAAIASEIPQPSRRRVVVDGIRQRATLSILRKLQDGRIAVLFVHVSPDIALKFYAAREKGKRPAAEVFDEIYSAPVEQEVRLMINEADAVLYNWMGAKRYQQTTIELMRALRMPGPRSTLR